MSTDKEWVRWGRQDPYFAVITNEKFRLANLNDEAKTEFFESGRYHIGYVLDMGRRLLNTEFTPRRALDFGCGVGRVALPMAESIAAVVGVDISPDMLDEARRNGDRLGVHNLDLVLSDDKLSAVSGQFDLVHTCITFQHIDPLRGRKMFERMVDLVAVGGVGAVQVTYAKAYFPETFGQPPRAAEPIPAATTMLVDKRATASASSAATEVARDPEMQMNPYNLNDLLFILQTHGVKSFHVDFTDHGGELGVFIFFVKAPPPSGP